MSAPRVAVVVGDPRPGSLTPTAARHLVGRVRALLAVRRPSGARA